VQPGFVIANHLGTAPWLQARVRDNLLGVTGAHSMIPSPPWVLLAIVGRTIAVYLLILIGVRLSGKREVGQMTPFDLTLLLLISNSVQNAMTGPDNSLLGGIVAAITLFLLNSLIAEYAGVNRRFRKFIQGSPALLIHNGECVSAHMAKEHVTMDELERSLREHGIACVQDVSLGVLEVDGSMSFLKFDDIPAGAQPHKRMKFLRRPQQG
jgi:uncharacterized membrane protein YcaP (DUF421 family)